MINKINNNDYHDYTQLKMPDAADKMNNGEKFSLNYQRAQEEKNEKDKKDHAEEAGAGSKSKPRMVLQGGVRLELSQNSPPHSDTRQEQGQIKSSGQSLFDIVKSWVNIFTKSLKELLYKIWNDETPRGDLVDSEKIVSDEEKTENAESVYDTGAVAGTEEPERLTEEYIAGKNLQDPENAAKQPVRQGSDRNKEIQQYLRSGNIEQAINLVTENGQKTIAKNSTLLTYYDRTGKITPLSASDQERILHGDRNVKKL